MICMTPAAFVQASSAGTKKTYKRFLWRDVEEWLVKSTAQLHDCGEKKTPWKYKCTFKDTEGNNNWNKLFQNKLI